jgi:hypothetical protein
MNANRSTDSDTPLRWLNIMQRGSTDDWKALYRQCQDRRFAQEVASTLAWRDPDLMPSARLWKFLLEDLHPGLKIDLREHATDIGV